MTATLNGPLLRELRVQAAVAIDYAAQILRVGKPTLARIESGDTVVARTLTLGGLLDLADLIDCDLADLFTTPASTDNLSARTRTLSGDHVDPQMLIALLHEADNQVSAQDLRTVFGCKSAALRSAAQHAKQLLDGTGLRLIERDDKLVLAPTNQAAAKEAAASLARTHIARLGLDNGQARVLRKVLNGQLKSGRKSTYTRGALGFLSRLGMLTSVKDSPIPSEALLYALDVPDQDT